MKASELSKLGVPSGEAMRLAGLAVREATQRGIKKKNVRKQISGVVASPQAHLDHAVYADLAAFLQGEQAAQAEQRQIDALRETPAPFATWGKDLDPHSIAQMENAAQLPVAVRGAIMPDAHVGYGLPIGGVLATHNAVIPYAVGVDIACRMKLSVLDLPLNTLDGQRDRLANALRDKASFGKQTFDRQRNHEVMDEDWALTPVTGPLKDRAWRQLGTSGGGNHFVEFGTLQIDDAERAALLGVAPGTYLALLSHSGSRGSGAAVAEHYSRLAQELHPHLPKEQRYLAWLDLDSKPGHDYWQAMELMGRYASANHAVIHHHVARAAGAEILATVENHHNFAWREQHVGAEGEISELIVHRKGATPAGAGVLGVIPGSMASPAFVVRGRGSDLALDSASHGAGRQLSRRQAKEMLTWSDAKKLLADNGVTLLSAGLDEVPGAYKNIHGVMAAQTDLVEVLARFDPKIVRMAGGRLSN